MRVKMLNFIREMLSILKLSRSFCVIKSMYVCVYMDFYKMNFRKPSKAINRDVLMVLESEQGAS